MAELSKTINKRKTNDIRKCNVKLIQQTLINSTSMKITRTFGIGRKQLHALKDEQVILQIIGMR